MEHILLNDDCLDAMKDLSDNSIDLLFCDLPYGQTDCKWDSLINLELFWLQINRICKITCPMFFTCTTKFGVSLINSNPKNFRYELIWIKSASCGFLNAKKMPMRKHEMIYVFYRKLPLYNIDSHKNMFLSEQALTYSKEDSVYGKKTVYNYKKKNGNSVYDPPLPNSLLEIKSEKGKHSTQKPVELMKWILKYYSKENDTILDPTMGSGSTGVACSEMNRKFIGIEKDIEIYKVALERNKVNFL